MNIATAQAKKSNVYSAVRWSALSKYGSQLMQIVISLTLARLLAPEHFGLLGMATVIVGFIKTCGNLGFRQALIQRKEIDQLLLSTVFWANLAVTVVIALILVGISPWVAHLYQQPQIRLILVALAVNFVIPTMALLPMAMLQKKLQFKQIATRELGGTLAGGIVAISMAYSGWGVWALIASSIATSVCEVLLLNIYFPVRITFGFSSQRLRESLRFGLNLTAADIFNYASRHADNLIIGSVLGPAALGYYTFAYKLMLLSRDSFTQVVNRVLFPRFAQDQDNDSVLASITLRACAAVALVSFPVMLGMAVLAEPFTILVVGDKWLPAVPILQILAPLGALQSLWPLSTYLILAKGRTDILLRWSMTTGLLLTLSFCIGVNWGIYGVAIAYTCMSLIIIPSSFWLAQSLVREFTLSRLASTLLPYFGTTAAMATIAYFTYLNVNLGWGMMAGFVAAIVSGAISYAIIAFLLPLPALHDFLKLIAVRSPKFSLNSR